MDFKNKNLPATRAQVQDHLLKFKQGGKSVEDARTEMLQAKEAATTVKGGVRVPKFIEEESSKTAFSGGGGNTPVNDPKSDLRFQQARLLESARKKIAILGIRAGQTIDLAKMQEVGVLTAEEVQALLIDKNGGVFAKSSEESVAPAASVEVEPVLEKSPEVLSREPAVAPTPVVPSAKSSEEAHAKIIDTKKFQAKIFREDGEWVALIEYKNGAGPEKFTASNKDELMMKLLEGKGFGTVKVRETVQRYKLGDKFDGWDFFYNELKEQHGLTAEQYQALPDASRSTIMDTIEASQAMEFQANYAEYYATVKNYRMLMDYLESRKLPMTLHNLELAYRDLTEDDLLETRPRSVVRTPAQESSAQAGPTLEKVKSIASTSAPAVVDSTVVSAVPAPAVPTASASAPSAPVTRKRVLTGLTPGSSSAAPAEVGRSEERTQPKEPSVEELRTMSFSDLQRIATKDRKFGSRY